MANTSTDPRSYFGILPEVLVKRVHINHQSEGLMSLSIRLLIRSMASAPDRKTEIDMVKNNTMVYAIAYNPDNSRASRWVPRVLRPTDSIRNRADLQTRIREYFPAPADNEEFGTFGSYLRMFSVGEFLQSDPPPSDMSFSTGVQVHDYTNDIVIEDIPRNLENLNIMVFAHLDVSGLVDSIQEYSDVNLGFANGYFNGCYTIGTSAKTTVILKESKVPEFYTAYIDSAGEAWTGPVHTMTSPSGDPLYIMKGSDHAEGNQIDNPILQERRVRNTKVVDTRKVESNEPPYYGGSAPTLIESASDIYDRIIKVQSKKAAEQAGRGVSVASPQATIKSHLHDSADGDSIGEIYLSVYANKDLDIMFNVDWMQILKRNSPYFRLLPVMSQDEVEQVMSLSEVIRVCLKRRRIHPRNTGISKFLSRAPKPMQEEPPVVVSSNYSMQSRNITPLVEIPVVYEDVPEEDHAGIVTFRCRDTTIKRLSGVYQYYVEYEFKDGFLSFFERFLESIDEAESLLNVYAEVASIPVSFIEGPDGVSVIDPDSLGNYNARTKEFSQRFKEDRAFTAEINTISAVFSSMMKFVNGSAGTDAELGSRIGQVVARSMLDPRHGATLETIMRFSKPFLEYKNKITSMISASSRKQSRRTHTSATTPSGQMPGYIKYTDYFDKTISTDHLNKPRAHYFPPAEPDYNAVSDLVTALENEASTFGFAAPDAFTDGLYLTMDSIDLDPSPMHLPFSSEEQGFVEIANPLGLTPMTSEVSLNRISIKSATGPFGFGETQEKMLRKHLSCSGKTSKEATGQKKFSIPASTPPKVETSDKRPSSQDPVYAGDSFAFSADLSSFQDLGFSVEIDNVSPSISSMLKDLPPNLLLTEEQLRHEINVKFDVLKKLTQNHIDQLTNQKKSSKLDEAIIEDMSTVALNTFSDNTGGLLGFIRTVSSFNFDDNSNIEVLEPPELQRIFDNIPPEVKEDVPPQFSSGLISNTSTHGVLQDGTLSKYVHGLTVEVKSVGAPSKGLKSAATQRKLETDLGKRRDSTRSNFNKMNMSSIGKRSSTNKVVAGKKYKICKLIPYEGKDVGMRNGSNFDEVAIVGEHFLVEI